MTLQGGGERAARSILIVEDEVLVRLMLADALREAGYKVIEAATGTEAQAVLQSEHVIAVMITDVKMPGVLDGVALARWTRSHNPSVKIIIVSGTMPAGAFSVADAVFVKPYEAEALVRRIAQLMRNGGAPHARERDDSQRAALQGAAHRR